jgi:hypothetical protein
MQCDGELDHPETGAEMPAGYGDSIDRFLAQFGGKLRQLRGVELAQVFRFLNLVEKRCFRHGVSLRLHGRPTAEI